MKIVFIISIIITLLSYAEVIVMYNLLSFVDKPYLYVGLLFNVLSVFIFFKLRN